MRFRTIYWMLLLISLCSINGRAQTTWQNLIRDDFSNGIQGLDLSLNTRWGNAAQLESAFEVSPYTDNQGVTLNGLTMTPRAIRYFDWHTDTSLKMLNSFDYRFPPINRNHDTLQVIWHTTWDQLTNGGENGRINVILLHDYPVNGPQPGWVDSLQITNAFGRPAYHLRLVARTLTNTYNGFIGYGGGDDTLGELYRFPYPGPPRFWTPGAVPGHSTINRGQYPGGQSLTINTAVCGRQEWRTYTWEVLPEIMHLYWRRYNEPATANRLVISMPIPKKDADSTVTLQRFSQAGYNISRLPLQYHWFNSVEAVRFYGVGVQVTRWGGVEVNVKRNPTALASDYQKRVPKCWVNGRQFFVEDLPVGAQVQLFSLTGQQIYSVVATQSETMRIDLPNTVSTGLYVVVIGGRRQLIRIE